MGVIQSGLNSAMTATVGAIGLPKMLKKTQVEAGKELQTLADKKYAELQAQKSAEQKLSQEETLKSLEEIGKSGIESPMELKIDATKGNRFEQIVQGTQENAYKADFALKKYQQLSEQAISQNNMDLYLKSQRGIEQATNRSQFASRVSEDFRKMMQDRQNANKMAMKKAREQSQQMNEIKQHSNYSEEDDFSNPYVGW